jgi:shikimate dehydrogenase
MPQKYSFGLLGYPLGHSLSPLIHAAALQALGLQGDYRLYPVAHEKNLPELLNQLREGVLQGLNVTIPYKRSVIDFMDVLTSTARSIGAINTISYRQNQMIGENTDAGGFLADLRRFGWFSEGNKLQQALILGAGGSARAVAYALYQQGWQLTIAARRIDQAEKLVKSLANLASRKESQNSAEAIQLDRASLFNLKYSPDLIVNTTPLGMSPHDNASPWPHDLALPSQAAVYDLVYNPVETDFTHAAMEAGLRAASGIGMLVEQAALSFEIWTGLPAPRAEMHASLAAYTTGAG